MTEVDEIPAPPKPLEGYGDDPYSEEMVVLSEAEAHMREAEARLGIDRDEFHALVMRRFEESKKERRGRERTWWLCLSFYLDDHYAEFDDKLDVLIPGRERRKVPKHRVREFVNHIKPGARELIGRMVRPMRTLTANPLTEDPDDVDRALLSTAILSSEWRRLKLTLKEHEAETWCVLTGTSGIWTRWNDGLGPLLPQTEQPRGENEVQVLSPFDLYPDPLGARYSTMRFMCVATEVGVEELREQFPEYAEKIQASQARQEGKNYERNLKAKVSASHGSRNESAHRGETTTLIHYYAPRTPKRPRGIMGLVTPGCTLWMDENPWAGWGDTSEDWCPVDVVRYDELPNSFWGTGPVESAIDPQKVFNRTLSQIIEQRNETSNPRWFTFSGIKVNWAKWRNEPGEVVTVKPPRQGLYSPNVYKPEQIPPLPIPSALFKLMADLKAEIEDIFAYHQVSKGGAPPGVRSGTAIENLQETDQAGSIPIITRHNIVWETVGRRLLTLVRDQWDDARIVDVRGDDGLCEILSFRGDMVPSQFNVTVDADTLLPTTRNGKLAALLQMVQAKAITPMEMRQSMFGGYGTIRAAIEQASRDVKKQRRENRKIALGVPQPVDNYDDHEVHLKELNDWRKSPSFDRLKDKPVQIARPDGTPLIGPAGPVMLTVGQLAEAHAQAHVRALVQAAQAADQAGAAGPEGPGGPEEAGPREAGPEEAPPGPGGGPGGSPGAVPGQR